MKITVIISLIVALVFAGCNDIKVQKNENNNSITKKTQCVDQKFDPNVNCEIIDYLENKTISANSPKGVVFCSYTSLNDNPQENPVYLLSTCSEYHPTDYELQCDTKQTLKNCPYPKNLTAAEYLNKNETCSDSCQYMKLAKQELDEGTGYAAIPMKITMHEDGTITHQQAKDGSAHLDSIKQMYPDNMFEKYLSQKYDHRQELILQNARKAEDYFKLGIGSEIKSRWWWLER